MIKFDQWNSKFEALKCCVIIPTYNNEKTLAEVIEGVLQYTTHIIIINDGSDDTTSDILKAQFSNLSQISFTTNKGKGVALRTAFKKAVEMGYEYAISIDSDGQHYPEDLPLFLKKLEEEPGKLLIGARNMSQENVPGKSSFGNKFSNFWFHLFTGIKLSDTQSGYRLYPVKALYPMRFFTRRFEFEVEVIVKAAWKGLAVENIPIQVHYQKPGERVSHFRPFQDFTRISLLNTYYFLLAIAFYIPFRFLKQLNRKSIKAFIRQNFFDDSVPIHIKALSIGFGVFMGIFPIWGYQLLVGIALAHFFKLNKPIFITFANISVPPMIPLIIFLSYKTGAFILPNGNFNISFGQNISLETVKDNLIQYLLGAAIFALICGFLSFLISYLYLKAYRMLRLNRQKS